MRRLIPYLLILGYLFMPVSLVWSDVPAYVTTQQKEITVYITKTGEKYHKAGCRYLSKSQIKTTKKEAIKNGYEACKVCKP